MFAKLRIRVAAFAAVTGLAVSTASGQITIPTVPIGTPGNAADPSDGDQFTPGVQNFGSVAYEYNLGITEVTNAQYAAFLNAKAASDPFDLYNTGMGSTQLGFNGGISRSGSAGSYSYSTIAGRASNPVNFVSIWDAMRFANWLHNGQGSGDTETGAYTLTPVGIANNTVTRNPGWQWAVASEDEWYKAAYHQPASMGGDADNYWMFPTSSNFEPTPSQANDAHSQFSDTTPVGSYPANYYGAFDMAGNLWEWNDTIILDSISGRGLRGGSFSITPNVMEAGFRIYNVPLREENALGFRVVQKPPPCAADFDGSGFVDSDDFVLFVSQFALGCDGPASPDPACVKSADFDVSGFVDSDDFVEFIQAFQTGC